MLTFTHTVPLSVLCLHFTDLQWDKFCERDWNCDDFCFILKLCPCVCVCVCVCLLLSFSCVFFPSLAHLSSSLLTHLHLSSVFMVSPSWSVVPHASLLLLDSCSDLNFIFSLLFVWALSFYFVFVLANHFGVFFSNSPGFWKFSAC